MSSKWRRFEVLLPLQFNDGRLYRDNLVRLIADVPDTAKNRRWMKAFKARWKAKLEQIDLWMVSYVVTIE
jgi:hypothetical protein